MSSAGTHYNREPSFQDQDEALLVAAEAGDESQIQAALDRGARVDARNSHGQTALHIVAAKEGEHSVAIVNILLNSGASVELSANNGDKPLYIAATLGHGLTVKALLDEGATPESRNLKTQRTALYQAIVNNHQDVAKDLLDSGADINAQIPTGETPLIQAVLDDKTDLVSLLRNSGADISIRLPNGLQALDLAAYGGGIFNILTEGQRLTEDNKTAPLTRHLLGFQVPEQPRDHASIKGANIEDKTIACRGFEATLVDFFPDSLPVMEMATIHDLLYCRGADAIMASAREAGTTRDKPNFRWCHFPANNMEWISTFIRALAINRSDDLSGVSKSTKFSLGLTDRAGQHLRATTATSSFMRPLCRKVKRGPINEFGVNQNDQLLLFMPYLHHEHLQGLNKMGRVMMDVTLRTLQLRSIDIDPIRPTYTRMALRHLELETLDTYRIDYELDTDPGFILVKRWVPEFEQDILWNHTKLLREKRAKNMPAEEASNPEPSFEFIRRRRSDGSEVAPSTDKRITAGGISNVLGRSFRRVFGSMGGKAVKRESGRSFSSSREQQPGNDQDRPPADEEDKGPSERARARTWRSSEQIEDDPTGRHDVEESTHTTRNDSTAHIEPPVDEPRKLITDVLNEALIKGYMIPKKHGKFPALQPRRTLDQYFYTHLQDTSKRDRDQVVFRYLEKESQFPRLFMVDQLWLWILNEDTVISCCPQVWDSWKEHVYGSDDNTGEKLPLLPDHEDERSIRNLVLRYIESSQGSSIKSVYDLANVIVDSCGMVFDQYQVSQSFQFMDFFERSIGKVTEKEAACFEDFTSTINNPDLHNDMQLDMLFDITVETALLVEIKDIRDELSILRMVLNDQMSVMRDFRNQITQLQTAPGSTINPRSERPVLQHNNVLESHLYRIDKMDRMAAKTYEAINHLLDLKQKQANASEARSARKQAEASRRLAEEAARQSDDTARQGKTLLVFTVITIIFLPLSFMAAFFAINIDGFNLTENGKLPMTYVIKYMFAISAAVSVPFVVLAFQQERFSKAVDWLKGVAMDLMLTHGSQYYNSSSYATSLNSFAFGKHDILKERNPQVVSHRSTWRKYRRNSTDEPFAD